MRLVFVFDGIPFLNVPFLGINGWDFYDGFPWITLEISFGPDSIQIMQILDEDGVRNMTHTLGKFNKQNLESDYKEGQILCS